MFRKSLSRKRGMLFLFDQENKYSFWMKNMYIPLDLIWMSKDKRIVDIMTNVLPCGGACGNLIPREKVQFVLEVNTGFVEKNCITLGDEVKF